MRIRVRTRFRVAFTDPVILVNWNFIFSFRTQTHPHNAQTHTLAHTPSSRRHIKKFICRDATAVATLATLSLSAHIIYNSPVPNHASILIPPLPFILLVLFVVTSSCCCCLCCRLPLNGICRLCVTHAGHYPFYRCLPFPVKFETLLWVPPATPPPPQPAACLLPLPLLASCLWPSLKSWHAACLTKSFFRLPFVLCSFDLASHTHTYTHTLTRRLMYVSWLTRFYWPSCLLVFCTLSLILMASGGFPFHRHFSGET